jgi:hypothetical protein
MIWGTGICAWYRRQNSNSFCALRRTRAAMNLACVYAQLQPQIRIRSVERRSFDPYILNEFAFCEQVAAILTGYR